MPTVWFPSNLSTLPDEGFGEVQTPFRINRSSSHGRDRVCREERRRNGVGGGEEGTDTSDEYHECKNPDEVVAMEVNDLVFCRPSKSGEIAEHFLKYHVFVRRHSNMDKAIEVEDRGMDDQE